MKTVLLIKIRSLTVLAATLLLFEAASAQALQCSKIFGPNIDQVIRELSELRRNLDLQQAQGEVSLVHGVLQKKYKEKEQALIAYLEKENIMSREQLFQRLKSEISQAVETKIAATAPGIAIVLPDPTFRKELPRADKGLFRMGGDEQFFAAQSGMSVVTGTPMGNRAKNWGAMSELVSLGQKEFVGGYSQNPESNERIYILVRDIYSEIRLNNPLRNMVRHSSGQVIAFTSHDLYEIQSEVRQAWKLPLNLPENSEIMAGGLIPAETYRTIVFLRNEATSEFSFLVRDIKSERETAWELPESFNNMMKTKGFDLAKSRIMMASDNLGILQLQNGFTIHFQLNHDAHRSTVTWKAVEESSLLDMSPNGHFIAEVTGGKLNLNQSTWFIQENLAGRKVTSSINSKTLDSSQTIMDVLFNPSGKRIFVNGDKKTENFLVIEQK